MLNVKSFTRMHLGDDFEQWISTMGAKVEGRTDFKFHRRSLHQLGRGVAHARFVSAGVRKMSFLMISGMSSPRIHRRIM